MAKLYKTSHRYLFQTTRDRNEETIFYCNFQIKKRRYRFRLGADYEQAFAFVEKNWQRVQDGLPPLLPEHFYGASHKPRVGLSPEEEKQLLEVCSPLLQSMISFALLTGLRFHEMCALRWSNVTPDSLRVEGGRARSLPVSEEVRQLIQEQRGYHPTLVWVNEEGHEWSPNIFRRHYLLPALKRANLEKTNWKTFCDTYVARQIMKGVSPKEVARLAGDLSGKRMNRFAHLAPKSVGMSPDSVGTWKFIVAERN